MAPRMGPVCEVLTLPCPFEYSNETRSESFSHLTGLNVVWSLAPSDWLHVLSSVPSLSSYVTERIDWSFSVPPLTDTP